MAGAKTLSVAISSAAIPAKPSAGGGWKRYSASPRSPPICYPRQDDRGT
eukprot:gene43130-58402_t